MSDTMLSKNRSSPCPHILYNLVVETGINLITTQYKKRTWAKERIEPGGREDFSDEQVLNLRSEG